ncbi:unnamed protein product [Miscanthus lutarioriparius]|uniref:Uncharacterized protein n=1 Tax=Miscanthus lutarioriparius TaxID=422564 RepID=A0A811SA03_9POAL|nr:unnamed protein product [Miscanthus lutarioriparius]
MALLVEGLEVGGDTFIEEYIIGPAIEPADDHVADGDREQIILFGPEEGQSWIARPSKGPSMLGSVLSIGSRHGSVGNQNVPLTDPIVTLFGSVHENISLAGGSMRRLMSSKFDSMISITDQHPKTEQWDEENLHRDDEEYATTDGAASDYENKVHSPLLSRPNTSAEGKDIAHHGHRGSALGLRRRSLSDEGGEAATSTGIGGGWQLAWTWSEREGEDGKKEGSLKRIYLHQEGVAGSRRGSVVSLPGGGDASEGGKFIHAAALVSQSALYPRDITEQRMAGPATMHPSEAAAKVPSWRDLFEPGVRRALLVSIGIQILQQFAGINGVLYYTPQIMEQAGVAVLISNLGLSSASASILISSVTALLMLPSIGLAMRLMDVSGRSLDSILIVLVVSNVIELSTVVHAVLSTISVITYLCCFKMGFGPIPNILCAEFFPTRVRGICIAICALIFWVGDIIVTYSLPVMLNAIGLAGVFGIYAVACAIAFVLSILRFWRQRACPLRSSLSSLQSVQSKRLQRPSSFGNFACNFCTMQLEGISPTGLGGF